MSTNGGLSDRYDRELRAIRADFEARQRVRRRWLLIYSATVIPAVAAALTLTFTHHLRWLVFTLDGLIVIAAVVYVRATLRMNRRGRRPRDVSSL